VKPGKSKIRGRGEKGGVFEGKSFFRKVEDRALSTELEAGSRRSKFSRGGFSKRGSSSAPVHVKKKGGEGMPSKQRRQAGFISSHERGPLESARRGGGCGGETGQNHPKGGTKWGSGKRSLYFMSWVPWSIPPPIGALPARNCQSQSGGKGTVWNLQ